MSDEQGAVYLAFINDQLDHERKRRESLDARGIAVLTSTAGLVTLLLALAVLLLGKDTTLTARFSVIATMLSVVSLVGAGVLGLLAHRLREYDVLDRAGYDLLLASPRWEASETSARSTVAAVEVRMIISLRTGNSKATQLQAALWLQLTGIGLLALAAGWQFLVRA